ncbi:ATP-binding cassette domain-containing protein [Proteus mirabilis]|uniref:ATP-binding cassette domain-containing protein n=1 Tax=Proteus mirabilis TaxID=584 RepID=A0ABD5LVR3_PROMI
MSVLVINMMPPVVRQISFRINKYETIGIVGTSGSGKSTLARIIAGLYIPQLGQVKLDGIPVCEIPPQYYVNK